MIRYLTKDQQLRLAQLLNEVNEIFTEEDNSFDDDTINDWYGSDLYSGISDVMFALGEWC